MQPVETRAEQLKRERRALEVQKWNAEQKLKGYKPPCTSSRYNHTTEDEIAFLNILAYRNWGYFMKYSRVVLGDQRSFDKDVDSEVVKKHIESLIEKFSRFESL